MFKNSVGGDCYHTILNPIFTIKPWFNNLFYIGAMAITPYGKSLSARFYFMPILFNGALENSTLRDIFNYLKHYNSNLQQLVGEISCFSNITIYQKKNKLGDSNA